MISFAFPGLLVLLGLLPLIGWWRRLPAVGLGLPATARCGVMPRGRAGRAERGINRLGAAAGTLLTVALAGPRWVDPGSRPEVEAISLALVVDVSASMAAEDFTFEGVPLSRLACVQKIVRKLLEGGPWSDGISFAGRGHDLVALVTYAARPNLDSPLTLEHSALLQMLDAQKPRTLIGDATSNPGDALAWAIQALQKAPTRRKAIILVTDGESNVPAPALTPRQAAQLAVNLGIPIHAVDALNDADPSGDANKAHETLRDLAAMTHGTYARATDEASLIRAFVQLDQFERDRVPTLDYRAFLDLTPWLAMAAFTAGALALFLRATYWRVGP